MVQVEAFRGRCGETDERGRSLEERERGVELELV